MECENIKEFIIRTKTSKSTIYRFYLKNKDLFTETKIRNGKRIFPVEHARYFDSAIMFDENKILRKKNKSMKNLIDCLADDSSLQYTFWKMEWSYFFTVAYKQERNKNSCFKQMHCVYDYLLQKYGGATELRMFFTTEKFDNRKGYHNHFIIYIGDKKLYKQIIADIKEYFSYDRVDAEIYDRYRGGLYYISKEGLDGEDWDFLEKNVKI